jgi:hypothetical protein
VVEALVVKRLVVVALVEVEFSAVKFCKVEEALAKNPFVPVTNPVMVESPVTVNAPPTLRAVVVAFDVEALPKVVFPSVVDPSEYKLAT